jgi:hypothetical protein
MNLQQEKAGKKNKCRTSYQSLKMTLRIPRGTSWAEASMKESLGFSGETMSIGFGDT